MRNLIPWIFGLMIVQACHSQNMNPADWHADLEYFSKELPKRHYDLFHVKGENYFSQGIEKLRSAAGELSDLEIAIRLQQLVASMGDSHTRVNMSQFVDKKQILPLHLFWFSDGLYVLHTTPENEEILGHRITSINQTPIKTVVDSLSTLVTIDNQAILKSSIPKMLTLIQVLKYFGFAEGQKIEIGVKDGKGRKSSYALEAATMNRKNRIMFKPDSLALCYRNERIFFIDYYIPNDKTYYIQYNKCWSKELEIKYRKGKNANRMPSFREFEEKVLNSLEMKPIEKIIFDLRFNGGGNSSQGTALIKKLAAFADKNPEKEVFVILGRYTFSSAILNAMDFKKWTTATFVGEETGGKPNHFGEVKSFRLPQSGLRIDYSTKYFKRTESPSNSLKPDIEIESDFNDFKRGIDPVYEWIKEQ
jgi:hypothetical protein